MPLVSKAQQGYLFANKPEMATRWAAETPNIKALPQRVDDEAVKKAVRLRLAAHIARVK